MKFRYLFLTLALSYLGFLLVISYSNLLPESLWWIANTISMGPIYVLALPILFIFPISFYLPWRRLLILSSLASIILLIDISGFAINPSLQEDEFKSLLELRILTSNLGQGAKTSKLLKIIKEQAIDITALQETSRRRSKILKKFHSLNFKCGGSLCLLSRFPIKLVNTKSRYFLKDWGVFISHFEVSLPTRLVDFIVVHLQTPRDGLQSLLSSPIGGIPAMQKITKHQNVESWIAANWASKGKNVIVAGDFNMTQITPMYQANWSWLDNAFQQSGNGLGYTKYTSMYGARIDHILFNGNKWIPIKSWVEESLGGDHRPVVAVIKPS